MCSVVVVVMGLLDKMVFVLLVGLLGKVVGVDGVGWGFDVVFVSVEFDFDGISVMIVISVMDFVVRFSVI